MSKEIHSISYVEAEDVAAAVTIPTVDIVSHRHEVLTAPISPLNSPIKCTRRRVSMQLPTLTEAQILGVKLPIVEAQQQLARWTSEDGVEHRAPQQQPPPPPPPPPPGTMVPLLQLHKREHHHQPQQPYHHFHHSQQQQQQQQQSQPQPQPQQQDQQEQQHQLPVEQLPIQQRGYYPSPPHTDNCLESDETENAQSHQQQNLPNIRGIDVNHSPIINKCPLDVNFSLDCNINNDSPKEVNTSNISDNENTALLTHSHFPEYKH